MARAMRELQDELSYIKRAQPEYERAIAVIRALARYADDEDVNKHIDRLKFGKALRDE